MHALVLLSFYLFTHHPLAGPFLSDDLSICWFITLLILTRSVTGCILTGDIRSVECEDKAYVSVFCCCFLDCALGYRVVPCQPTWSVLTPDTSTLE